MRLQCYMPAEAIPPLRRNKSKVPDANTFNWQSRLRELEALSREHHEREVVKATCKDANETSKKLK